MPFLPLVISHAAYKGAAPENTLAGVRAAVALGVDGIEIDVQCSLDRVPVLMHDATVERTTDGAGPVARLTLAQLRAFDAAGASFGGAFAGECIPTLAETLDLTRGRCLLVVEIKGVGIERDVLNVIGAFPSDVMVWSFRSETVARIRDLAPLIPCVQLLPDFAQAAAEHYLACALRAGLQGVSVHHPAVSEELTHAAALRGLSVYSWTADEPAEQQRLAAAGVTGIVSNVPEKLMRALGHPAGAAVVAAG